MEQFHIKNLTKLVLHAQQSYHLRSFNTVAATLFSEAHAFCRSDSEWAAETNSLMPTGKRHLSRVDLFETTTNIDSSFKACKFLKSEGKTQNKHYSKHMTLRNQKRIRMDSNTCWGWFLVHVCSSLLQV